MRGLRKRLRFRLATLLNALRASYSSGLRISAPAAMQVRTTALSCLHSLSNHGFEGALCLVPDQETLAVRACIPAA